MATQTTLIAWLPKFGTHSGAGNEPNRCFFIEIFVLTVPHTYLNGNGARLAAARQECVPMVNTFSDVTDQ